MAMFRAPKHCSFVFKGGKRSGSQKTAENKGTVWGEIGKEQGLKDDGKKQSIERGMGTNVQSCVSPSQCGANISFPYLNFEHHKESSRILRPLHYFIKEQCEA